MKIFKLCKVYLLSHKYTLAVYSILILVTTIISILSPYIIGNFLDDLIEDANIMVILRFSLMFGSLSLFKIVKGYVGSFMYTRMQTMMSHKFYMDVTSHVLNLSLSYTKQQDSTYLSQRVGSDAATLIAFCISLLKDSISNIILLLVPFVLLLRMNYFVTLLMVGFLVVYAILYFIFKRHLYDSSLAFSETRDKYASKLVERLRNVKLIKYNSIQNEMNNSVDEVFNYTKKSTMHHQKVNYLYSSMDGIVTTIAQIALFVVGGLQVLADNFTVGMFTVFTSYFNMMLSSGRYFSRLGGAYQSALVSYDRIADIMELKQESCGFKVINNVSEIKLSNVCFSYSNINHPNKGERNIDGLNASFDKGSIYAITGSNGAGKSTLINLIIGMYIDEYRGCITFDGIDIRDIDMVLVRKNVLGFAEQEPNLLNNDLWYNLTYTDCDKYSHLENSLDKHISTLNMQEFVSKNSMGFVINEKNNNISGGEKQKISILKVLLKNSPIMIFDEPTSALDYKTTKKFMKYLQESKSDKIIIIISHDDAVIERCDEVVKI